MHALVGIQQNKHAKKLASVSSSCYRHDASPYHHGASSPCRHPHQQALPKTHL